MKKKNGIKEKRIIEHPTVIEILDDKITDELNQKRADCLSILNRILKEKKLELVESELI